MATGSSELKRLQAWLEAHRLLTNDLAPISRGRPTNRVDQSELLQLLNRLESRFDDVIAAELAPPLDWQALREELGLVPSNRNPWSYIGARARERFEASSYPRAQVERVERLWRDFLFLQEGHVKPLQVPSGWLAALDYLLQHLYFSSESTQQELGARYAVSASTVGLRFRALVETLGVELFDHPARKRLTAARALTVDQGQMSPDEFHQRLLRGEFHPTDPRGAAAS